MFSGLMSRWTSPEPWAWASAERASRSSRRILVERQRSLALDQLRQAGPVDQLHRVPQEPRPPGDVEDVDDVRVAELGGELRLTPKALDYLRVLGERGVQHLERHLALEVEVAHPVHPAEAPGPEECQQLVVVAEGTAQPFLPPRPVFRLRASVPGSPTRRGSRTSPRPTRDPRASRSR